MHQKIVIETGRLYLAEFKVSDARHMYRLNLDPEVLKYTGDPPFASVAEARDFLDRYDAYEKHGFGRWSVWLKEESAYIGWCGLKRNEEGLVDIGFRFFRDRWNQGFATESARACLEYGFGQLQLDRIVGRADLANKASIRVLEKIGMRFWKEDSFEGIGEGVYYVIERKK
jgi:RimJ/RimL family protein N-acetyltransferase